MLNFLINTLGKINTTGDCMALSAPSADLEAVKCRIK